MLALDVSVSVNATEDAQQRQGLAAALDHPDVRAAIFASPDPVALNVFEWSGRSQQTQILPWIVLHDPDDLDIAIANIRNSTPQASGQQTALGYALGFAAQRLAQAPDCLLQTIDVSGDGANNAGFGPRTAYSGFPFDGVIVNGLVISRSANVVDYYQQEVIRGPGAFVEVAESYADYAAAMRRKLIRELTAQIIGRSGIPAEGPA